MPTTDSILTAARPEARKIMTGFRIEPDKKKRFDALAKERGTTASRLLQATVEQMLKDTGK